GEAAKRGEWAPWLETHNSYTEVSSECGIPGFICYMAFLIFTIRLSYKLYKQTVDKPEFREIMGMSYCLLMGALVYAVSTFFFHMAYTGALPVLGGLTLSLHLAAQPV